MLELIESYKKKIVLLEKEISDKNFSITDKSQTLNVKLNERLNCYKTFLTELERCDLYY